MVTEFQTTYIREANVDANSRRDKGPEFEKHSDEEGSGAESLNHNMTSPRTSYLGQLKVWNGVFTDGSLLKLFLRPLPFLLSPAVNFSDFVIQS